MILKRPNLQTVAEYIKNNFREYGRPLKKLQLRGLFNYIKIYKLALKLITPAFVVEV